MNKKDKVSIALEYARALLDSVGLSDWSVGSKMSFRVGATMNHDTKTITFNDRYIMLATKEDFRKATMHEAAHALLGYGKAHGQEFVDKYSELYPGDPFNGRCIDFPIHKYKTYCNECKCIATSNSTKDSWCINCALNGVESKLDVSVNKLELKEWASTP